MTNCKNCKMTDEYCASGDCPTSQSPRNDLATKSQVSDLTEQWKKGELPEGVYYCNTGNTIETLFTWGKNYHQLTNNKDEVYIPEMDDCEVLAEVPDYVEWQNMVNCACEEHEANKRLIEQNKQLKELLKECKQQFEEIELYRYDVADTDQEDWFKISTEQADIANKMIAKIDEVLKCGNIK